MSTIQTDVAAEDLDGAQEAADAFSKLWGDDADEGQPSETNDDETKKKKPASKQDEDTDDDADADDEASDESPEDEDDAEGDDDENEGDDEEAEQPTVEIKDEHKIKVVVDGQEQEFTLGSLKRLAGQEASLTRKGQEVAAQRKGIEERSAAQLAQMKTLLDRAKAKYEPYSKIDLLAASKDPNISAEELVAVRNAAKAAYEDVAFLEQETTSIVQTLQHQARQELIEQARESIKVLSDPEKGIEGFNEQLYGEIRTFAVESGLPADIVNDLVNPAAIKLINMARLYAKGQKTLQTAKPDKKKAPKRIVKSTATPEATKKVAKTAKAQEPMKRSRQSGSVDDAADAFMARWSNSDDE